MHRPLYDIEYHTDGYAGPPVRESDDAETIEEAEQIARRRVAVRIGIFADARSATIYAFETADDGAGGIWLAVAHVNEHSGIFRHSHPHGPIFDAVARDDFDRATRAFDCDLYDAGDPPVGPRGDDGKLLAA